MNTPTPEKRIRDIMIFVEEFSTVNCNSLVRDVVCQFKNEQEKAVTPNCSTILVLNDSHDWIGVLDRKMILRTIRPHTVKQAYCSGWNVEPYGGPVFWPGLFTESCRLLLVKRVDEVMYPREVITIEADSTLIEALYLLTEGEVESLVVVKDGEPVGLVCDTDIFNQIFMC